MPPLRPPKPPAAPPNPAARQREAARMMMRLDAHWKKAQELAEAARGRVSIGGLTRYRHFTRRIRDFFSLAATVEERLDALPPELADQMLLALDRLHARMVILFVETSAAFFSVFARAKYLPLGTYEICGLELRGLMAIRAFLDDPRYDGERGQALRAETDRIAGLMRGTMERMPPLPDFGDQPSIGPRGAVNKPVKAPPRPTAPARPASAAGEAGVPGARTLSPDDFRD